MTEAPKEHCEHECVCPDYFDDLGFPCACDGILIPEIGKREKCQNDTRSRTHTPAQQAQHRIDAAIKELGEALKGASMYETDEHIREAIALLREGERK